MAQQSRPEWRRTYRTEHKFENPVAEPVHRIPPEGFSTGVSIREHPRTTFDSVIQICQFYEKKCSGYKSNINAARYVFQMSTEVQCELDKLKQMYQSDSTITKEWLECFGLGSNIQKELDDLELKLPLGYVSPKRVATALKEQAYKSIQCQTEVAQLRDELKSFAEKALSKQELILHQMEQKLERAKEKYAKDLASLENEWRKKYEEYMREKESEISFLNRQRELDLANQKAQYTAILCRKEVESIERDDEHRRPVAVDRMSSPVEISHGNAKTDDEESYSNVSMAPLEDRRPIRSDSVSNISFDHAGGSKERSYGVAPVSFTIEDAVPQGKQSEETVTSQLRKEVKEKDEIIEMMRRSLLFEPRAAYYESSREVPRATRIERRRRSSPQPAKMKQQTDTVLQYKRKQPWDLAPSRDTSEYLMKRDQKWDVDMNGNWISFGAGVHFDFIQKI